ncbi:MAG: M20/M25/M40 family metallo-hydrolase [Synergistaceae bacterium]|jgi:tripeptide aminopeptidase|nr:M20/M25/M40 family metallo-hydrolase [Synergistaceae bacterium]
MIDSDRMLETFLEYVRIDSETLNEKNMSRRVAADLEGLGLEVWTDDAGAKFGSNGSNVYARMTGNSPLGPLLFSAHVDTVKPGNGIRPVVEGGAVTSGTDTVLGADDKSGVAAVVEALRTIKDKNRAHRTVEVMFSIAEEGGLRGAKNADMSGLTAKKSVVLDAGGDVGHIITSAPGQINFEAWVKGRAAHAGACPEEGVSALQAAAEGIASMNLLRVDHETTANIAVFKSEHPTNIVPDDAHIVGEARSHDARKLSLQMEHMKRCLEDACLKHGARLECKVETVYASYKFDDDDPLVAEVRDACARIGIEPAIHSTGGGSDANVMNRNGIKAIVLSTGMEAIHTKSERITLKNLTDTARLCLALMTGGPA